MKHTYYKCDGEHEDGGWPCPFCAGGLAHCTVCNGSEGTLPTDCPGRKMTEDIADAVWKGFLDFKEVGGWQGEFILEGDGAPLPAPPAGDGP